MADPVAVVAFLYDVTKDLYEYYRSWSKCGKDVRDMRVRLLGLHQASETLKQTLASSAIAEEDKKNLNSSLVACNDSAKELQEILEKIQKREPSAKGAIGKLRLEGRKALYPFRESTIKAIAEQMDLCRDQLDLVVDLQSLKNTIEVVTKLESIDTTLVNGSANIQQILKQMSSLPEEFATIRKTLLSLRTNTAQITESLENSDLAKEREQMGEILDWLCKTDYGREQDDAFSRRTEDTGTWFLEHQTFTEWVAASSTSLFCPGHPGAGKTTIAATVINYLNQTKNTKQSPVLYVFFRDGNQHEQNLGHILSTFLRQIVRVQAKVPHAVKELFDQYSAGESRPPVEIILEHLSAIIGTCSKVYLVLDALDECRSETLAELVRMISQVQNRGCVQLLATSRPHIDASFNLPAVSTLPIRASDSDLTAYIKQRIPQLPPCATGDRDLQVKIIAKVLDAVDGIFLLARLHLDSLRTKRSAKRMEAALEDLPRASSEGYDEAFSSAMNRITCQLEEDRVLGLETLAWIFRTATDISPAVLLHALATEVGSSDFDERNITPLEQVLGVCAGLVIVDEKTECVRLVHLTFRAYLERSWRTWFPEAESMIARKCVTYLCLGPLEPLKDDHRRILSTRSHTFSSYAAYYWAYHIWMLQTGPDEDTLCKDIGSLLSSHSHCVHSVLEFYAEQWEWPEHKYSQKVKDKSGEHPSGNAVQFFVKNSNIGGCQPRGNVQWIHLAAYFGVTSLVAALVHAAHDPNCLDGNGRTPLCYAAIVGHEAVVRLLQKFSDVNWKAFKGRTPLSSAVLLGNEPAVKMLMHIEGVDVNAQDQTGASPISLAIRYSRSMGALKALLDNPGIDLETVDILGRTTLSEAVESGSLEKIQLLLDTGRVDWNSKDYRGCSLLTQAVTAEHADPKVVQLVLENSQLPVDHKDESGRTAFSYAAQCQLVAVMDTLLKTGQVDVNSKDRLEITPLSYCVMMQRSARAAEFLIKREKVAIDLPDFEGRTALSYASAEGRDAQTVQLLLDMTGVQVNATDKRGRTALSYAAGEVYHQQRPEIVKLLVNTAGVKMDSKDDRGRTPLSYAAENRVFADEMVKLLVETNKVEVDSRDNEGRTPLSYAADNSLGAVEVLLDTERVDIDREDGDKRKPFWYALKRYGFAADAYAKRRSPDEGREWYAKKESAREIICVFLGTGKVNLDTELADEQTPLSLELQRELKDWLDQGMSKHKKDLGESQGFKSS